MESDNPFLQCHIRAEVADRGLTKTNWHRNPYKWLDDEDLERGAKYAKQQAGAFLRSLLVNRKTEFDALFNLAKAAFNGYNLQKLTNRQALAVLYAQEAKEAGLLPSRHVAYKLGIGLRASQRLLKRSGRAKMFVFTEKVHSSSSGKFITAWKPSKAEIKRKMASKPRICGWCGELSVSGAKTLCFSCYRESIQDPIRYDGHLKGWLGEELRRIENEHREWAVNQLYLDHYGTISLEQYERMVDAA